MRHKPENPLRKSEWFVETCSRHEAQRLVAEYHYAQLSSPVISCRHGLFRYDDPVRCQGAALWIPPTREAAVKVLKQLDLKGEVPWQRVLALSRLVVAPEVPTNGASFLMTCSEKLIRKDGVWKVLVTYADTRLGHTGAIYKATGWTYLGETGASRSYIREDGMMIANKTGSRHRSEAEMAALGAVRTDPYPKHKFAKVLG